MRNGIFLICGLTFAVLANAQNLVHTSQLRPEEPSSRVAVVQAASTSEFLDSVGVATHMNYLDTPYQDFGNVEKLLLGSGIRNIRDGGTNEVAVARFKELRNSGIALTWYMDPTDGVAPTPAYWTAPPHYTLSVFLKNVLGTGSLRAVEISNEIDVFYQSKRWSPGDHDHLSNDPDSAIYWGKYIQNLERDTWRVLRSDPEFAAIQVLGTSFGASSPGVPPGAFYNDTDVGTFHPYMYRGNSSVIGSKSFDSVPQYFVDSTQPSVDIDEHPTAFEVFGTPYKYGQHVKPMIATETGYYTGSDKYSISDLAQAKYVPRIYTENFRHNIQRTFIYEFVDEGSDGAMEHSFGLVNADLSPKPAYIALQSLLSLLDDPQDRHPVSGTLTYSLECHPNQSDTRTQYVHDLLLEKSNGDFYLLLWHEISDANRTNPAGAAVKGTDLDVSPSDLNVAITLPFQIRRVILYRYGPDWRLRPTRVRLKSGRVTLKARDQVSVLQLIGPRKP